MKPFYNYYLDVMKDNKEEIMRVKDDYIEGICDPSRTLRFRDIRKTSRKMRWIKI